MINSIQVGITVTFVLCCFLLLWIWRESFAAAIKDHWFDHKYTPEQWLIVGICVGFGGNALDNAFWGVSWVLVEMQGTFDTALMPHGPTANIFFRQIPGIISVYCHLRAAVDMSGQDYSLTKRMIVYVVLGLGAGALLMNLKAS